MIVNFLPYILFSKIQIFFQNSDFWNKYKDSKDIFWVELLQIIVKRL